jgi:hypothetical protein
LMFSKERHEILVIHCPEIAGNKSPEKRC